MNNFVDLEWNTTPPAGAVVITAELVGLPAEDEYLRAELQDACAARAASRRRC